MTLLSVLECTRLRCERSRTIQYRASGGRVDVMSAIDEPSGMHRPSMIEIVAVEPDADGGVDRLYDPICDHGHHLQIMQPADPSPNPTEMRDRWRCVYYISLIGC